MWWRAVITKQWRHSQRERYKSEDGRHRSRTVWWARFKMVTARQASSSSLWRLLSAQYEQSLLQELKQEDGKMGCVVTEFTNVYSRTKAGVAELFSASLYLYFHGSEPTYITKHTRFTAYADDIYNARLPGSKQNHCTNKPMRDQEVLWAVKMKKCATIGYTKCNDKRARAVIRWRNKSSLNLNTSNSRQSTEH